MSGDNCCNKKCDSGLTTTAPLSPLNEGEIEETFRVSGADCNDEVVAIQKALKAIGISTSKVNLISGTVTVRYSETFPKDKIAKAIESTGVKIIGQENLGFIAKNKTRVLLTATSGAALALGLILDWIELGSPILIVILYTLSTLLAGKLVFPKAFRAIRQKTMDINVLMTVAVVGAFGIKEYSEGATVVFLFSIAELLEAFSIDRARKAIREVLKLTPQMASRKQGDAIVSVPVLEVAPGELLLVKPGENIPLDGKVVEGTTSVNQAPVTGESRLVEKVEGDSVFAGTINENGLITIEVTKAFQDTKISQMIKLIEEAQEQKAPSERFVDRFAKIYTPIIFAIAVLLTIAGPIITDQGFDVWFYRALVLLVIACPCALVLATPVSVVSGLASLARRGVLVKGGIHLESLGQVKMVAVDKTGTLTEGNFKVQNFKTFSSNVTETEVLGIAGALERASSHPLAKAVLSYIEEKKVSPKNVEKFRSVPGRGAEGYVDSHLYFAGNHRYTHELGVCTPELEKYLVELEDKALSVVIIGHAPHDGHAGDVLGVFSLGDSLRPNAKLAVQDLHRNGVNKVVILSGDNQKTVDAIKKLAGIDEGYGDLLPEDKVEKIKALTATYKHVAMVGDGINDAPALAHATLGISMGAAGTDTAIETSDIALMQDNLQELAKAIEQGRRVLGVIRFNIGFALVTKLIFLVLAISGKSNLWLAVAADMGASLFVTTNALRLLHFKPKDSALS